MKRFDFILRKRSVRYAMDETGNFQPVPVYTTHPIRGYGDDLESARTWAANSGKGANIADIKTEAEWEAYDEEQVRLAEEAKAKAEQEATTEEAKAVDMVDNVEVVEAEVVE